MQDYTQLISGLTGTIIGFAGSLITVRVNKRADLDKERRKYLRDKGLELYKNFKIYQSDMYMAPSGFVLKIQTGEGDNTKSKLPEFLIDEIDSVIHTIFPSLLPKYEISQQIWQELAGICIKLFEINQASAEENIPDIEKENLIAEFEYVRDVIIPEMQEKSRIAAKEFFEALAFIIRQT